MGDITVCLPGANIEDVAEKAGQGMSGGTRGAVLVHVGTNNAEKGGTSAIVSKHRRLVKTFKEARTVKGAVKGAAVLGCEFVKVVEEDIIP